jgi:single-strand DNA-binding protein
MPHVCTSARPGPFTTEQEGGIAVAGETTITLIGNLTAPGELRFTPSGAAVINFTVASTPRNFDKASGEWKDGSTLFMRCALWRQAAENMAESNLEAGARVMVSGRLVQRSFEHQGQKRTVVELEVDEVGPSLKYATAKVNRVTRSSSQGDGSPAHGRSGTAGQDPWGASADDQEPF